VQTVVVAIGLFGFAPAPDAWAGEYTRLGGWDSPGRGHHVAITRDGDGYRIDLKGYETFKFVEVRPGVLECRSLGTITRGTLRFEGGSDRPTPFLRADFCYEWFYLEGPPAAATRPGK
jgi:hypothetical protein